MIRLLHYTKPYQIPSWIAGKKWRRTKRCAESSVPHDDVHLFFCLDRQLTDSSMAFLQCIDTEEKGMALVKTNVKLLFKMCTAKCFCLLTSSSSVCMCWAGLFWSDLSILKMFLNQRWVGVGGGRAFCKVGSEASLSACLTPSPLPP